MARPTANSAMISSEGRTVDKKNWRIETQAIQGGYDPKPTEPRIPRRSKHL